MPRRLSILSMSLALPVCLFATILLFLLAAALNGDEMTRGTLIWAGAYPAISGMTFLALFCVAESGRGRWHGALTPGRRALAACAAVALSAASVGAWIWLHGAIVR